MTPDSQAEICILLHLRRVTDVVVLSTTGVASRVMMKTR